MTKIEVIAKLTHKTGIPKPDIQVVMEELFQLIQDTMLQGESVHFKGFGKFLNKKRAQKLGRNLSDNTAIIIDEHYIPSFKPAKAFITKVKETVK
mgnify:CR=1 FL=1